MKAFHSLFLIFTLTSLVSCLQGQDKQVQGQDPQHNNSFSLLEAWETDTVLRTPESVIYDEGHNFLYVSNINENPSEKDHNGFIAKLDTSGNLVQLHWIEGLNGPKGMGIYADTLFVADIDQLVLIDIVQSRIIKKIDVPGASFLNDVAVDPKGDVYFSDSNTGIIHVYSNGKIAEFKSGLDRPNGLYIEAGRVLVNASKSGEVLAIDKNSKEFKKLAEGIPGGDGLEYIGKQGYYIVSAWAGEVYIITPEKNVISLMNTREQEINSADIEYIPSAKLLLVPTFYNNRVVAYRLKGD